jgi:quercetin dioxygenase-like cupin family protein
MLEPLCRATEPCTVTRILLSYSLRSRVSTRRVDRAYLAEKGTPMPRPVRLLPHVVATLLLALLVSAMVRESAAGSSPASSTTPSAGLPGVTSKVLAHASPLAAPDKELSAVRVTIQPGASIPAHEHPGTQVAAILSGSLTYTVLTGEIPVTRGATGTPSPAEVVRAGQTVVLQPGDFVVEEPGALHMARNEGSEPVVISLATLFPPGQPRTIFAQATPAA